MEHQELPQNVRRLQMDETFSFCCHPGVSCFTHCCRQLELALTPYDVLRLKRATGLVSSVFLERYVITEQDQTVAFPRLYLTMIDDGQASCVFVAMTGCTVYRDRPGACRAYPMGRATILSDENSPEEFYVLLAERHCRGFDQSASQTPKSYSQNQGLDVYNRFNDAVGAIQQHQLIRQGMVPTKEQIQDYLLSLYDLDTFREAILSDSLPHVPLDTATRRKLEEDDEELLLFAIEWLKSRLFSQ